MHTHNQGLNPKKSNIVIRHNEFIRYEQCNM